MKALIKGNDGGLAQMGERLLCTQEVIGSIPLASIETVVSQGLVH